MFDIKSILNDKLEEANKKYEPYGGLAIMMTARDYAALEFAKLYISKDDVHFKERFDMCYHAADAFIDAKKERTKSS